eukprot:382475-Prymnesium_polylepis.1
MPHARPRPQAARRVLSRNLSGSLSCAPPPPTAAPMSEAMLRAACGACADPDCLVRSRMAALLAGEQCTVPESDHFVLVNCSNTACEAGGQMHPACYERT